MKKKVTKLSVLDFCIVYIVAIIGAVTFASVAQNMGGFWSSSNGRLFSNVWVQDALMILGVLVCLYLRGQKLAAISLVRPKVTTLPWAVLAGGVLYIIMDIALVVMNLVFSSGVKEQSVASYMHVGDSAAQIVFILISMAVVAPVAEEMLFRGLLYHSMRNGMHTQVAMLITNLIFGLSHLDMQRALPLALGGYLLNLLMHKHGSLWSAVIAHGTWNALMVLKFYQFL